MRAAQAAASSGVAMGFTGGSGFATGAANFVGASGAFCSVAAGFAAGAASASRAAGTSFTVAGFAAGAVARARHAAARGARQGLAASRRSEHDSQFLRAPGAADLRALSINLTWRTSTWYFQLEFDHDTRGPQTFVVNVQMLV